MIQSDFTNGLESPKAWHGDIKDDHVRSRSIQKVQELKAAFRFSCRNEEKSLYRVKTVIWVGKYCILKISGERLIGVIF